MGAPHEVVTTTVEPDQDFLAVCIEYSYRNETFIEPAIFFSTPKLGANYAQRRSWPQLVTKASISNQLSEVFSCAKPVSGATRESRR